MSGKGGCEDIQIINGSDGDDVLARVPCQMKDLLLEVRGLESLLLLLLCGFSQQLGLGLVLSLLGAGHPGGLDAGVGLARAVKNVEVVFVGSRDHVASVAGEPAFELVENAVVFV